MESNTRQLSHPYKLNFAVTYRCNSRCKNCGIWRKPLQNELSLPEIEKFAKENRFFSWVNLTGGEPFLRNDLYDICLTFSKSADIYLLNITTNGFDPSRVARTTEKIASLGIPRTMVVVSLDGPKKTHESARGLPGSWDNALETFRALKELEKSTKGFKTLLGYTILPENMGKFAETVRSVRRIVPGTKTEDFHVNIFHVSPHYYSNSGERPKESTIKDVINIKKIKSGCPSSMMAVIENIYLDLASKFLLDERIPVPCKVLSSSVFLDPTGDVFPCTIYNRRIGNIREMRLRDMLVSERSALHNIDKKCPQCWTPCEAYSAILGNIPRTILKLRGS